ncbi:MAG: response regulator [Raineya sp.]|jgi:CheY-like chemotaxis protein|nr:response regulator [Raineya sp.]
MFTNDEKFYMIIDDDIINNMVCQLVLKMSIPDVKTLCFENPLEALKYLKNEENIKPTVILLDINMPEIDGWQFLEQYEQLKLSTRIVILSSSTNENDKYRAEKHPLVINYVSKPLTVEKMMKVIRTSANND